METCSIVPKVKIQEIDTNSDTPNVTEKVLAALAYRNFTIGIDSETVVIEGKEHHKNNYAESDARAFLKDVESSCFFNHDEALLTTEVDNSKNSANCDEKYACDNTNDKLFLPSYKEMTNASHGFSTNASRDDTARRAKPTEFAVATGCAYYSGSDSEIVGNSTYWLRSPYNGAGYAKVVDYAGDIFQYQTFNSNGLRICANIQIG